MSNLFAIVRATRASANAVRRIEVARHYLTECERTNDAANARRFADQLRRNTRRYEAAQRTLADNPLPGDAGYPHTYRSNTL